MTKYELRNIYLTKQKALTPAERADASTRIAANFFANLDFSSIHTVHCFLAIEKFNEVDTTQIIHCFWKNHPQVRIVVPRVDFSTNEMENVLYTADSEIRENRWLIPEPPEGELIEVSAIDLVIVPSVCVDKSGHRVGYGKGFYDRFLKRVRRVCLKVGISYFEPVDVIEDVHDGDERLDLIITQDRIYHRDTEMPR